MFEKNTLKSSLEVFPFVVQVDENSLDKNISSTNNIIVVKDGKIDNLGENLNARVTAIKNGECLEITIPEGMEEKAFLSENGIKVIQLVSKLGCSKLRIISAKKDVNDTETNNVLNKVFKKSEIEVENQRSTINNIKSEDADIEPADDNVFHIAEAIIAKTLGFKDKRLGSNEENVSGDDVKGKVRELISATSESIEGVLLCELPDFLEKESTAFKRATTKLLAKVCENVFNVIRHDKDIQRRVNDLSSALIDYAKNRTNCSEDGLISKCKNIIMAQENLKKLIENAGHIESVNEVLNFAFVRAAVDKFYKKFGDLSNPNAISGLKSIFNSIYDKSERIASIEKGSSIDFDTHLNNLIYGLGFHPSSVDIELENLAGEDVEMTEALSALGALSKEHALTIKNGKKFEVLNTGSYNDNNCAFRAISIGAGFGPNGYNIIQQKVVEGAQKLLKMLDGLDHGLQVQIARMLIQCVDTSDGKKKYTLGDVKKLLKEYINCRGQGFVSGVQNIECLFAAVGLGCPICVSNNQLGKEYTFLPDGRKEDGIRDDYSTFGKPVYVGFISGHAEALLPLDNKGSRKMDNKLPELDKKVSDMKDAISKHISGVIYDAINEQSSLLKIIARDPRHIGESFIEAFLKAPRCKNDKNLFVAMKILAEVDSKLDADKKVEAYNLEKEIRIIAKNKASGKLSPSQEEVLQNKLKKFVDIFADKAVKLCKEKPLFWDNVNNSLFREW